MKKFEFRETTQVSLEDGAVCQTGEKAVPEETKPQQYWDEALCGA